MNYALCLRCGHEADVDEFKVVAEDGVNIREMDLDEVLDHDLKFECPKCAGVEVNLSKFPVKRAKVN